MTEIKRNIDERKRIVNMFGQHVSPEVVNKLLEQRTDTISEMRYVCVMFLDIRNFTEFTEGRNPEEVITYLNNQMLIFNVQDLNPLDTKLQEK